jgi:cell division septal protein FtsQ
MMPRGSTYGDTDQRYWRARANRRVRKARLARNLARWGLLLSINLAIAAVLFWAGAQTLMRLKQSDEFLLTRIEIIGGERASVETIRQALSPYLGKNVLDLRLADVDRLAKHDPWVLRTSVKRVLPDRLRLTIEERSPTALAVIGGVVHVIDSRGYVLGPSGAGMPDDLPLLTGLDRLSEDELVEALRLGVRLLIDLHRASPVFARNVSELDLARPERVAVRTVEPGPALLLDPQNAARNLHAYLDLRDEIEHLAGPASYVDLRWRDRISVKPIMRFVNHPG